MDIKIWVAIIGVVSAALTSALALFGARQQARREFVSKTDLAERDFVAKSELAKLDDQLAREREERHQKLDSAAVLARYGDPLIHATFFLQQRLFQILRDDGRGYGPYLRGGARQELAVRSTLYRFGEYLTWREIVRREIQFLPFEDKGENRRVQQLTGDISRTLATDDEGYGTDFMLWVEEQRAIADLMIVTRSDVTACLGFADFMEQFDSKFERWFKNFGASLSDADPPRRRLTDLFNMLLTLGDALDPENLRYSWREWQEPNSDGKMVGKLR
ncbi:hypothetical protein OM076_42805 [Solirubrobacter ginsenosidimutans]|uniref:Uncharacterized protein n=1 Tax=Solirubrobacter ginsenosidimutans TaxID=490573 RepID=A0A9X3SBK6_9ACTN|nr:hypothetical protein [Solirubrobacter ginsenosidimutans]MDA0167068.1 hypothetical protein [Solirubrobacter ginsenosidimutans]